MNPNYYYREHKIGYIWNHEKGVIASPKGVAIPFSDCGACSEQSEESPGLLRLCLATAIDPRNDLLGRM
jgi:hypothetical protein